MKTILGFKIAKFEFKVTVHYGLWAKPTSSGPFHVSETPT